MSDSLRNISENYLAIRDELFQTADEETGEFDTALLERLNAIQESFEVKAQNCALVCLELHDRSEAIEKEIKRLQTLLKRAKKGEEWLRGYLSDTMQQTGYERITGDKTDISFRGSEQCVIDDLSALPNKYLKIEYKPDIMAIKADIKSGQTVLGAHIEKKKNLQIK